MRRSAWLPYLLCVAVIPVGCESPDYVAISMDVVSTWNGEFASPLPCTPITCESVGADCGWIADGCGDTINCGYAECNGGICGGTTPNVCEYIDTKACVPRSCDDAGANCGFIGDDCGEWIDCGGCDLPERCGADTPNVCGTVSPAPAPTTQETSVYVDSDYISSSVSLPDGSFGVDLSLHVQEPEGRDVPLQELGAILCSSNALADCDDTIEGTATFTMDHEVDCKEGFGCLTSFDATIVVTKSMYFTGTMDLQYREEWAEEESSSAGCTSLPVTGHDK